MAHDAKLPQITNTVQWFVNSGASAHMTLNRSLFSDFKNTPPLKVIMGDESKTEVPARRNVELELTINGTAKQCFHQQVLYVTSSHYSLIFVGVLCKICFEVSFANNLVTICRGDTLCATGSK